MVPTPSKNPCVGYPRSLPAVSAGRTSLPVLTSRNLRPSPSTQWSPAHRCFASVWKSASPCSIETWGHGARWNFACVRVSGLPRRLLRFLNSWTASRQGCGFRRCKLPERQHRGRLSTRPRNIEASTAISAEIWQGVAMKTGTLEEAGTLKAMAPLHVLIVEHSRNDVELILHELRGAGFYLDHTLAENKEQFRRALQHENFDAILSDYRLPNWTGLEALQELRATGREIPFLLVSGTLGEEAAVECIKQGVTDYILKDQISRLPGALRLAIGEKALREETKQAQNALADSETRGRQQFAELDLLYRSLPVALAVFGCDMRFLRVNDEVAKFDGLPAAAHIGLTLREVAPDLDRKSTRLNSSHSQISYAVFCLKKKKRQNPHSVYEKIKKLKTKHA